MQRESQKDRTILCKYDPTEPGDYRVEVKWAGDHVPGSPFMVMIFDTQQELNRFLQVSYSLMKQIAFENEKIESISLVTGKSFACFGPIWKCSILNRICTYNTVIFFYIYKIF